MLPKKRQKSGTKSAHQLQKQEPFFGLLPGMLVVAALARFLSHVLVNLLKSLAFDLIPSTCCVLGAQKNHLTVCFGLEIRKLFLQLQS